MKRKIENTLLKWKANPNRKPLIIQGARQVGKTTSVRMFAKENYKNIIEINFERQMDFIELFENSRDPKDLLSFIQLSYLDTTIDENTLLFLDEIQACPNALTALKFLKEEFPCDIIASGSLLGITLAKVSSYPVGYVETIRMYPMTFIEFLEALNIPEAVIDKIEECINLKQPVPEMIHEKMNELFISYLIVGGMPEVVKRYVETKDYKEVRNIQKNILMDYTNHMAKYASSSDRIKVRECFNAVPLQLTKDNKKFQYKLLKQGGNARMYESSLKWLEDSGMIIRTNRLSSVNIPLEVYREEAIFKVYYLDTGLLISNFNDLVVRDLLMGNCDMVYKGAIYENIVAQMLKANFKDAYYYEPNTTTEIDFITYYEGNITPIEVKTGNNARSKSLNFFVQKHNTKQAFKFSIKNISVHDVIHEYPLYALEFILQNEKSLI